MHYQHSKCHALSTAPRSMADPAFSWMDVKMRAADPATFIAYVMMLSCPVFLVDWFCTI